MPTCVGWPPRRACFAHASADSSLPLGGDQELKAPNAMAIEAVHWDSGNYYSQVTPIRHPPSRHSAGRLCFLAPHSQNP